MYRSAMYWNDAENEDDFFEWRRDHACEIGADTWIGHDATILAGRKMGVSALVGAGAVVSRDIPPYTIAAGVPAEVVRPRFEPRIAERLQALPGGTGTTAACVQRSPIFARSPPRLSWRSTMDDAFTIDLERPMTARISRPDSALGGTDGSAVPIAFERTVLANARLVLDKEVRRGSLVIEDGLIGDMDTGGRVPPGAMDCEGDLLAPGLIELHTDNLDRNIQPRPGVHWPLPAAIGAHDAELASVGVITVFDALRVGSVVSGERKDYSKYARGVATEILRLRAAHALKISHFLHLRAEICSETLLDELAEFTPQDRVRIVSLMDHTPGQRQFRIPHRLREYLTGKYGMSEADIESHFEHMMGLPRSYGAAHEIGAVEHTRRLSVVLASHDDTTIDQVTLSAEHGVTLAEFPTTKEAALACSALGISVMMGAPNLLRGGWHSGNVAASELAEEGLLDILSSDYVPSSLLHGAIRLGEAWSNLAAAFATVTARPARAAGLPDRGRLVLGLRVDLIRVELAPAARVRAVWVCGNRSG